MSDFKHALEKQANKPWVKKAERGERAEGVRDALKAGRGDILAGTRKLGMKKEGLPEAKQMVVKRRQAMTKKGKRK